MGEAYAKATRRIGPRLFPLFLTLTMSAEILDLRGNPLSRVLKANQWDLFPSRTKKGAISLREDPPDSGATLEKYWEAVARYADHTGRRFLRSEWRRTHSFGEPGACERDVPLGRPPGDEDPSPAPLGRRFIGGPSR